MATKKLVSVVTANSNSGSGCVADLLGKFRGSHIVRAVFRTDAKAEPFRAAHGTADDVEVLTGVDASKPETLPPAFTGAAIAVIVTPHDPAAGMKDDSFLVSNLFDAAVGAGVGHIIHVGSWTVNHAAALPTLAARFAPSEARLRDLADAGTLTYTVLRGGYFMNNFLAAVAPAVKASSKFSSPVVHVPAVDPRDIGRVAAAVIAGGVEAHANKTYEISGPEMLSSKDIAAKLTALLGRPVEHEEVPVEAAIAPLPPFLKELVTHLAALGPGAVPQSTTVADVAGSPNTLDAFFLEHKAAFE